MELFKHHWFKIPRSVRKPLVLVIGSLVILGGIILLPLPGPGWVVIFFGFAILATEFEFAEKLRDQAIATAKQLLARLKLKWRALIRRSRTPKH